MPHPPAVLITGASTGIGRACTLDLVARNYLVFAGVRREADADSLHAAAGPAAERQPATSLDEHAPATAGVPHEFPSRMP